MAVSGACHDRESLTFVVRLWRETAGSGEEHWRGRVEHIASQEVVYVDSLEGVAEFLERWARPNTEGRPVRQGHAPHSDG